MRKRTDLVENFSTFLQLDDTKDSIDGCWNPVLKLHQNISRRRECDRTAKEEYWAKLILREALESEPLAKDHLAAYLEEVAYWTAIKIHLKWSDHQLRKVDCFDLAREGISQPVRLFHRYDFQRSGVKGFATLTLRDYVSDALWKGREREKYGKTGLLRSLSYVELERLSKKRLFPPETVAQHRLLLKCFKQKYVPTRKDGTRALQWPDNLQLETIALYYNESRSPESPPLSATEVGNNLQHFVNWVRSDDKFRTFSIEDLSHDWEEEYHAKTCHCLPEAEDEKDREIDEILGQYFSELPEKTRTLFELYYGLDIKQNDLCQFMGFEQQYQLSRFLKSANKELSKKLSAWVKENWAIALSHEEIDRLIKVLKIWLNKRCAVRFQQMLKTTLLETHPEEVGILAEVAAATGQVFPPEMEVRLQPIKTALEDTLKSAVETLCCCPADEMRSLPQKVANFVELYLKEAPYAEFYPELKKRGF